MILVIYHEIIVNVMLNHYAIMFFMSLKRISVRDLWIQLIYFSFYVRANYYKFLFLNIIIYHYKIILSHII